MNVVNSLQQSSRLCKGALMSPFEEMTEKYSIKYNNKLRKVCAPLFDTFSINYFYYQFHSSDGKYGGIASNVDFVHEFCASKMQFNMPFITTFNWNSNHLYLVDKISEKNYTKYHSFLRETSAKYKSKHEFSLTKKENNYCLEYGFGMTPHSDINVLINNTALLKKFISYFESTFKNEIQLLFENPILLKEELGNFYIGQQSCEVKDFNLTENERINFLKQISNSEESNILDVKLTKREIEILKFYYKGKSASEVGRILNLSTRTVQNYLQVIKDKFMCSKKSQLFECLNQMNTNEIFKEIFID